jgi:hypothetical protein
MAWEIKHCRFTLKAGHGLPGAPINLIVARDVSHPATTKFFVGSAMIRRWRRSTRFSS